MTIVRSRFTVILLLACSLCGVGNVTAGDEGVHFKATLVWGTNNPQTDDSELKPVPPNVARKLGGLGLTIYRSRNSLFEFATVKHLATT